MHVLEAPCALIGWSITLNGVFQCHLETPDGPRQMNPNIWIFLTMGLAVRKSARLYSGRKSAQWKTPFICFYE
jgi:hypothetical protein